VKRSRNSLRIIFLLPVLIACGDNGTKELREFAKIEAAIGMVAGASTFDRNIRLEQLEKISITSKTVRELQQMCADAYRSFNRAAALLEAARQRTQAVEETVKDLKTKKETVGALTEEEASRVREMSRTATESLKSVTKELDAAEEKVAACQAKRSALRAKLSNR